MSYNLDRLNAMITSSELLIKSKEIMSEYQDAINKLMNDNVVEDVKALADKINPENLEEVQQLASEETVRRMSKYGMIFFDQEIERLMDAFNDGVYTDLEYNMRCEILSGLKDSLVNFDPTLI